MSPMTSFSVVNFIRISTELVFNPSNTIWLAWIYLSSSVSNPRVSLELKRLLLIYRQSLSSTPATHCSPWLHLIQQAEVWRRTRKVTDIQDYFCSFRDGQQCVLGEVCKILQLVLVMPATNCTSESSLTSTMYCLCTKKEVVHWTSPILWISLLLGLSYVLGLLGSSSDKK